MNDEQNADLSGRNEGEQNAMESVSQPRSGKVIAVLSLFVALVAVGGTTSDPVGGPERGAELPASWQDLQVALAEFSEIVS
jgi:hypothetical protein